MLGYPRHDSDFNAKDAKVLAKVRKGSSKLVHDPSDAVFHMDDIEVQQEC